MKPEYESVPAAETEAEAVVAEAVPEPELPAAAEPPELPELKADSLLTDAEPEGPGFDYLNLHENTPVPAAPVREAPEPEDRAPTEPIPNVPGAVTTPAEPLPAEPKKSFLSIIFDGKEDNSAQIPEKIDEPAVSPAKPPAAASPAKPPAAVSPAKPPAAGSRPAQTVQSGTDRRPETALIIDVPEMEIFTITLDKEGWLLGEMTLAAGDSEMNGTGSAEGKIRFIGREYYDGKTIFSFYPYETASFIITFRRTDYSAATVETRTAVVSVLPLNEYAAETEASPETETALGAEPDNGVPTEDEPAAEEVFIYDNAAELLSYTDGLKVSGRCAEAVNLLEEGLENLPWTEHDHLYFELAGLYEKCPWKRDERVAVRYYRQIVDYYPVSIYWQRAKERITYLERYFIHIR